MKKFKTLDKGWKEILFAASGFGPNLLMVLMGAFFTDAVNPAGLDLATNPDKVVQTISGACLIVPWLFPILWFIGKAFDGIIDIPFASITDTIKTKWGRRRLPIAICFIPMVISYALCWVPISQNPYANTFWIAFWALVFFSTYTMCLISFYGSLSTVCHSDKQRLRVSSFKSFFDTITYCLVYALVPLILGMTGLHIDKLVFILLPTMISMIIPLFLIKEGDKFEKKAIAEGYDIVPLAEEPKVGIVESIKLTIKNRPFVRWCLVNACSFFGLQMFLVAMNALILGGMDLNSTQMAILNTCAFAPVPVMLYLFNKLKAKKGIRFAYQTCLISFSICILSFIVGSRYVMGDNTTVKMTIGIIGGLVGSWAIGSFFMMPYLIPNQIAAVENKLTKKNHSAMYFAAQAVTTSIIGAFASGIVYENIKMLFISKSASGIVYAESLQAAAIEFGVSIDSVYNLGVLLVPVFVSVFCLLGFVLAFGMPKNYTAKELSKMMNLEAEYEANKHLFDAEREYPFEAESLMVNISLWVLSGSIFGYIWNYGILRVVNKFAEKKTSLIHFILSIIIPFYNVYFILKLNNEICKKANDMGIKAKKLTAVHVIFNLCLLGVVSSVILQNKLNKIAKVQNKTIDEELK